MKARKNVEILLLKIKLKYCKQSTIHISVLHKCGRTRLGLWPAFILLKQAVFFEKIQNVSFCFAFIALLD